MSPKALKISKEFPVLQKNAFLFRHAAAEVIDELISRQAKNFVQADQPTLILRILFLYLSHSFHLLSFGYFLEQHFY